MPICFVPVENLGCKPRQTRCEDYATPLHAIKSSHEKRQQASSQICWVDYFVSGFWAMVDVIPESQIVAQFKTVYAEYGSFGKGK